MSNAIKKQVKIIGAKTADFILPPLCPATGEIVDTLGMVDPAFWQKLNFIHDPKCTKCGHPFSFKASHLQCAYCMETPPKYNQSISALAYDDESKNIILRFKHGDQTHAVKAFTPWLKQIGTELLDKADIVIPVPLHKNRLIKRRYNQADLIAKDLVRSYPHITYLADGLIRTKNTKSQGHKKALDRKSNVAKAFKINPKHQSMLENKNILIIDDVYTTGATLNECAKTLYNGKAKEVNCLTIAKVIKD